MSGNGLVKGTGKPEEIELIGEYVDVLVGNYIEERYYFGRPWSLSDYVLIKRVPLEETQTSSDEDIPF
ncbi:hypothetical protein F7734_10240 [Scytonema sp. UIC 10036]|uniref:hypothetical protein n=1 Tax=Scytonema sp. UIC 10036 TaxID=2304196 RepID=UPI0012DADAB6|nr:hypothetical protein [Scytonema sp. UIC 10036]MUG92808.1 hypothetical protein [Scytonema sp. UIC 10036]